MPAAANKIAVPLLLWYAEHGRDLPWRGHRDPYRIWVSELMLQQTRVDTVLQRWDDFLKRFPSIAALAAASDEDVRAAWSGLGFYRRARNLHAGAKQLMAKHDGRFPQDSESVAALPGVGRYTMGAILSHAFDQRLPILDGNVARVLARLFRVKGDPKSAATSKELWRLAEQVLPTRQVGDFNQALMDLGATVCTPRKASCMFCPLQRHCGAFAHGQVELFPAATKKTKVQTIQRVALALQRPDGAVLLVQRPAQGLLADLWEMPAVDLAPGDKAEQRVRDLATACGAQLSAKPKLLGRAKHVFSHRIWQVKVYAGQVLAATGPPDGQTGRWVTELSALGVPTAARKILQAAGLDSQLAAGNK